jgi:hypothetical protein
MDTMNWEKLFDDTSAAVATAADDIWEEEPVDFKTFVESPEYCGKPPDGEKNITRLSEVQYSEIARLTGTDPKKIFTRERKKKIGIFVWGKGAGKGTTACLFSLYVMYLLQCMRNPHGTFGVAREDPLLFVNVAIGLKQSRRLFQRIVERLKNNAWFYKKFRRRNAESWNHEQYPWNDSSWV